MDSFFYFAAAALALVATVCAGVEASNGKWRKEPDTMTKEERRKDRALLFRNAALICGALLTLLAKGCESL